MGTNTRNEAGFSAVETILVLIIVVLISVVGYMVYKGQGKTRAKTSAKAVGATSSDTTGPTVRQPAYFDFKELSVKFVPDKSLSGLSYSLIPSYSGPAEGVYVTDSAVQAAFSQCQGDSNGNAIPSDNAAEASSFAGISRVPGSFDASQPEESILVKQFNGFFISIGYPNGNDCASQSQADNDNWQQANQAARKALLGSLKSTIVQD